MRPDHVILTLLRPLARYMIARGVTFGPASDLMRTAFVQAVEEDYALGDRRLTDSRISLLTGLQRRDVKRLRGRAPPATPDAGPLPRVIARWQAHWSDADGATRPLPHRGTGSFETLMAEVSRDLHPRTVLDELIRLGVVARDDGDRLCLVKRALIPSDTTTRDGYLAANLGDHASAAIANSVDDAPAHLDQAVHYDHLSAASVAELEDLAREASAALLSTLNTRAAQLQASDIAKGEATMRFRTGVYAYATGMEDDA